MTNITTSRRVYLAALVAANLFLAWTMLSSGREATAQPILDACTGSGCNCANEGTRGGWCATIGSGSTCGFSGSESSDCTKPRLVE